MTIFQVKAKHFVLLFFKLFDNFISFQNIKGPINGEKIKCTYLGTMNKDSSKWKNIKEFVTLTKNMKFNGLLTLINDPDLKEGSFRKKYDSFKRVTIFLSYLHPNDYARLELPIYLLSKNQIGRLK